MLKIIAFVAFCLVSTLLGYQNRKGESAKGLQQQNRIRSGDASILGACIDRFELRKDYDKTLLRKVKEIDAKFRLRLTPHPGTGRLQIASFKTSRSDFSRLELEEIIPDMFVKHNCLNSYVVVELRIIYRSNRKVGTISQIIFGPDGFMQMNLY
jgi:hypothetical protein